MAILEANKGKNFVKRIRDPNIYPRIDNEDGTQSTHRMADAEADGRYYVYPTIIQDMDGSLIQIDGDQAFDYARKNNEWIEFPSQEEASQFAKEYKKVWKQ